MLGIVAVFIGGGIGTVVRYIINVVYFKSCSVSFPWHTMLINIVASFLLGFLLYFINANEGFNPQLKLLLTVGFCGGLSTFSTFSCEVIELFNNNRVIEGLLYIFLSITICLIGTILGAYFAKYF